MLNIFFAFGVNEAGKYKTDRYNIQININTKEENITNFIQALETLTGYICTTYDINREKQKHIDNNARAILTLRDSTLTTPPITMPLRFSPVNKSDDNINSVRKAFTTLIGLVEKG